jgi:hypothetical protein
MKQLLFVFVFIIFLGFVGTVEAGKYHGIHRGRPVVVHTRPGPVIVHRVLPPYGIRRHVYARPAYVQPVPVVAQPIYTPVYAPVVQPAPIIIGTDNFYLRIGR